MNARLQLCGGAKHALLGSAFWGWASPREEVFAMLDAFAAAGGGVVDTAVNYPVNRNPVDFGRASAFLSEWLRAHRPNNITVLYKIGSINNLGDSSTALSASDILLSAELARGKFSDWLGAVAIHWDDREDPSEIEKSLRAIADLSTQGLTIGFSGVRRPDLYLRFAPDLASKWLIQVKENVSTHVARENYQKYFPAAKFIAYGINMGGVKGPKKEGETSSLALRGLEIPALVDSLIDFIACPPQELVEPPTNLNQLAMMLAWANPALSGVILGPRSTNQLKDSLRYWESLSVRTDASQVFSLSEKLRVGA